jgi:phage FluMu protein Com
MLVSRLQSTFRIVLLFERKARLHFRPRRKSFHRFLIHRYYPTFAGNHTGRFLLRTMLESRIISPTGCELILVCYTFREMLLGKCPVCKHLASIRVLGPQNYRSNTRFDQKRILSNRSPTSSSPARFCPVALTK